MRVEVTVSWEILRKSTACLKTRCLPLQCQFELDDLPDVLDLEDRNGE